MPARDRFNLLVCQSDTYERAESAETTRAFSSSSSFRVLTRCRPACSAVRPGDRQPGRLGLSPKDISRFSPQCADRRSRATGRDIGPHCHGAPRVRSYHLFRRYILHPRNAFRPCPRAGALMLFDVQTVQPLELEAGFERDFELEWPAAIGGTYINWDV